MHSVNSLERISTRDGQNNGDALTSAYDLLREIARRSPDSDPGTERNDEQQPEKAA